MMTQRYRASGFTIIEIMVAMAMTSVLLLGTATMFSSSHRGAQVQTSGLDLITNCWNRASIASARRKAAELTKGPMDLNSTNDTFHHSLDSLLVCFGLDVVTCFPLFSHTVM